MKKLLPAFLFFAFVSSYGQYNESAPWVSSQQLKAAPSKTPFNDLSDSFNDYWKGKDHNKKRYWFQTF